MMVWCCLQTYTAADGFMMRVGDNIEVADREFDMIPGHIISGYLGKISMIQQYKDGKIIILVYRSFGGIGYINPDDIKRPKKSRRDNKPKISGQQTIICIGYTEFDGTIFECSTERIVAAADFHHVTRCRLCQQNHSRIRAKIRRENKKVKEPRIKVDSEGG